MNHLRYCRIALLSVVFISGSVAQREPYVELLKSVETTGILRGAVNSTVLAATLVNDSVKVWDGATLAQRLVLKGVKKRIAVLDVSLDGRYVAGGGIDGQVIVWNAADGSVVQDMDDHSTVVVGVRILRNGTILTSSSDAEVRLSMVATGKEVSSFSVEGEITCQAVDPEEKFCAFGTGEGRVQIVDIAQSKVIRTLADSKYRITAMQFSPDKKYLVVGSIGGAALFYDAGSWTLAGKTQAHSVGVSGIAFDAKSRWVITIGADSTVRMFSTSDRARVRVFTDPRGNFASASFPGNEALYTFAVKGTITKWRILETPPDTIRPIIVMVQPTQTADKSTVKFYGAEYTVEGIACDDSLVKEVTVNGVPAALQSLPAYDTLRLPPGMKVKSFRSTVKFEPGATRDIDIKATDWLGNATSQTVSMKRVGQSDAIEIVGPVPESETEKAFVRIQFKNWFDIASYSIAVNLVEMVQNRPVAVKRYGDVVTQEIPLIVGYNHVQITASSKSGERITKTIGLNRKGTVVVQDNTPAVRGSGAQKWAVVVGISEYANPAIPPLKYADADARALADFLSTPEGGGFENDHMKVLLDKDATIANIQNALSNFLAQAIDIDLVVIYFAGHGAPEPARPTNLYLLAHDSDPNILRTTAFPMWQIQDVLARYIAAKRIVVFSDACHSGGISADFGTRGMAVTKKNLINQYLTDLSRSKEGVVVFTASAAGEVSQEEPALGHGVFTYYLLDGMKGAADFNNDYTITVNELMQYVEEQVKRKTQGAQNPTRSQTSYDKNLTIAIRSH